MQFAICNFRCRFAQRCHRRGGVYIAVLGTSLIVALLAMAALVTQRIQNRIVTASADIRQAQLNAHAAVELALLTINNDADWRTNYPHGRWFTNRDTGAGACSLEVIDPLDADLTSNPDSPVVIRGIGTSGPAEQRVQVTIDPRKQPLGCLRSAITAGGTISLQGCILRSGGRISANQMTTSSSQVYGDVEATSISGFSGQYKGATTEVEAGKLPALPDWSTVFDYYRTPGIATEISYNSLPASPTSNPWGFARNWSIENGTTDWTGTPPGLATAQISQSNNWSKSGGNSLRVSNRDHWSAGAAQRIEHFVKPGQQYDVGAWVRVSGLLGTRTFRIYLYTKGTGDSSPLPPAVTASASVTVILGINLPVAHVTGRLTVPAWSGDLEYAFIKVSDDSNSGSTSDFWVDDVSINEVSSGGYIYRQVLSPGVNTLYTGAPINSQGLYWIDCGGNRITIERSRIQGTLLLVNPGPGSSVAHGPMNWSPAAAGYPALLVDNEGGSFRLGVTNRVLSELENRVDYNLDGALNHIYPSEIRGLVAARGNLTYANRPLIRGQLVVGGDIASSSGELEIEFLPDSLLSPPPGFWHYSYPRRPASARKAVLP